LPQQPDVLSLEVPQLVGVGNQQEKQSLEHGRQDAKPKPA